MRRTFAIIIGALVLAVPASAHPQVQTFTVHDQFGLHPRELRRIERAITAQSRLLRHYWGTPLVHFGRDGWPITLKTGDWTFAGHNVKNGHPQIVVSVQMLPEFGMRKSWWDAYWWSTSLSHEVMETLADPDWNGREVCDPVADRLYRWHGVWLADFVLPTHGDLLAALRKRKRLRR